MGIEMSLGKPIAWVEDIDQIIMLKGVLGVLHDLIHLVSKKRRR